MKNFALFLLTLSSSFDAFSMLTQQEEDCFKDFDTQKELKTEAFKKLSKEDFDTITTGVRYKEHPEQLEKAIKNTAIEFCNTAKQKNVPISYSSDFLEKTLLKMKIMMQEREIQKPTDLLTARMYVFSQLLTKEEQATVQRDNYKQNPQRTREVMQHYAELLATEVINLNLLEDTPEARQSFTNEIVTKKMSEMEGLYNK